MFFVHVLASRRSGTLHIGVTNDLSGRPDEHRSGKGSEFSAKYGVTRLVYFETDDRIDDAISREKQLKGWKRAWKIKLIERSNPNWVDVGGDIPFD